MAKRESWRPSRGRVMADNAIERRHKWWYEIQRAECDPLPIRPWSKIVYHWLVAERDYQNALYGKRMKALPFHLLSDKYRQTLYHNIDGTYAPLAAHIRACPDFNDWGKVKQG